jgi:hypothetical protein
VTARASTRRPPKPSATHVVGTGELDRAPLIVLEMHERRQSSQPGHHISLVETTKLGKGEKKWD